MIQTFLPYNIEGLYTYNKNLGASTLEGGSSHTTDTKESLEKHTTHDFVLWWISISRQSPRHGSRQTGASAGRLAINYLNFSH